MLLAPSGTTVWVTAHPTSASVITAASTTILAQLLLRRRRLPAAKLSAFGEERSSASPFRAPAQGWQLAVVRLRSLRSLSLLGFIWAIGQVVEILHQRFCVGARNLISDIFCLENLCVSCDDALKGQPPLWWRQGDSNSIGDHPVE